MNDKNKDLLVRGLTALVFVPTVLGCLFGGQYLYSLLFVVVLIGCSVEYYHLIFKDDSDSHFFRRNYGIFLSCFVYFSVALNNLFPDFVTLPESEFIAGYFWYYLYWSTYAIITISWFWGTRRWTV